MPVNSILLDVRVRFEAAQPDHIPGQVQNADWLAHPQDVNPAAFADRPRCRVTTIQRMRGGRPRR